MLHRTLAALAATQFLAFAAAQVPIAIPFARTQELLVVDSTFDGIWRLADFNQDGDYNDPGEISVYYSDTVGAYAWSSPWSIVAATDGTVYAADVGTDTIYAMRDGNGDGDANDPGEHWIFFDGSNASLLPLPQAYGLTVDAIGRVFAAVNNATTPAGPDRILKLQDLNGDGDALDLNESVDYYNRPGSTGMLGLSIPTKVVVGPDGNVYFTEGAGTGFAKGVWRLVDLNLNGHCNDPGEANVFWTPPFTAAPQYWGLAVDYAGNFVVSDHSNNEQIWRGRDDDASGSIDPSEQSLFYQAAPSFWYDVVLRDDGTVLLSDSTNDQVIALRDGNGNGQAQDPGERTLAYDSLSASLAIATRGAAMLRAPLLELSPPIVPIGQTTQVVAHTSKPGDLAVTVISVGLAPPFPLAPWGMVEIDISAFVSIGVGFADAAGDFTVPFAIPANPSVIGTYAFQTLAGDLYRLFLSNAAPMTVTP